MRERGKERVGVICTEYWKKHDITKNDKKIRVSALINNEKSEVTFR